jgi:hypothetical protein
LRICASVGGGSISGSRSLTICRTPFVKRAALPQLVFSGRSTIAEWVDGRAA